MEDVWDPENIFSTQRYLFVAAFWKPLMAVNFMVIVIYGVINYFIISRQY
jgi:hypothetical protein